MARRTRPSRPSKSGSRGFQRRVLAEAAPPEPDSVRRLPANPHISDWARPPAGAYPIGPPPSAIPASSSAVPPTAVITSADPICPPGSGAIASAGSGAIASASAGAIPGACASTGAIPPAAANAVSAVRHAASAVVAATSPEAAAAAPPAHQFQLGRRGGGSYVGGGDRDGLGRIKVGESQCKCEGIRNEPILEHFEFLHILLVVELRSTMIGFKKMIPLKSRQRASAPEQEY
jgi:hypothetical protein